MNLKNIAAAVITDRTAMADDARIAAESQGRDALRDRKVTTPAHHARVVQRWADMSEAGTELAARMAETESRAAHVFNNLEAHGKAWLRGVIEAAATGRKCDNSVMDVVVHVLQKAADGETVFSSAALRAVPKNNHGRVVSAVRAYFRAYNAAVVSTSSIEVNPESPCVVALTGAMIERGMILSTAAGNARKGKRSKGE